MPFGPFQLKNVRDSGPYLVLELADSSGRVLYRPKRKLSYSHSHEARRQAERLIGSMVVTETYDPSSWPPEEWWLSVRSHTQPSTEVERSVLKVFGPPGTGKTAALIEHVKEHVKKGVQTDKIAFLAFTNVAADVARGRVLEAFPEKSLMDFPNFCTLHSLATRLGALMGRDVLGVDRLQQFDPNIRKDVVWMKKGDPSSAEERADHLPLRLQSFARARCISLDDAVFEGNFADIESEAQAGALRAFLARRLGRPVNEAGIHLIKLYLNEYNRFKQENRLADFDDVIESAQSDAFANSVPAFDLLIVDEAQDLSDLQWRFVHRLAGNARQVVVAGDDDQAIMVPFGASPTAFLDLAGKTAVLSKSRRVPKAVYEYVMAAALRQIIKSFPNRRPKEWAPVDSVGQVVTHVDKVVRHSGNDGQSGQLAVDHCSLALPELLNIVNRSRDEQWLIMAPTKNSCRHVSKGLEILGVPHYLSNRPMLEPEKSAADIRVMTIHSSKGDEAQNVALVVSSQSDYLMLATDPRLRYVALTRAKRTLYPEVRGEH